MVAWPVHICHRRLVRRLFRLLDHRIAFALIACALLMRALMPVGWMPATGADGALHITICTGMGAQNIVVGADGKLHKQMPAGGQHDQQPCGFGALALGLGATPMLAVPMLRMPASLVRPPHQQGMAIGQGLAAPPPPSTGPPILN